LYGNLFYKNQPVVLNYNFEQLQIDREILLTPLAINDSSLIISEILLEGQNYTNYNPTARILNLPAETGGHFTVTYEPVITNIVPEEIIVADGFELMQNYPNPFNPSTKISWQSPVGSQQTLKIYDILGNEVANLVDEYKPAGFYEIEFNASSLPSGVYFYQLKAGEFIKTKKMIFLK
jgi:hypothetical protein